MRFGVESILKFIRLSDITYLFKKSLQFTMENNPRAKESDNISEICLMDRKDAECFLAKNVDYS